MRRLSELWFRLIESVSIIILSFAFFWGAMYYLSNFSTISNILTIVTFIVDYILFVMPFAVIGIMIRGDKIGDKKRFILRFPLQFILFWLKVISKT